MDTQRIYDTQDSIINFSDILYVYKFHEGEVRHHRVLDHTLVYVYSGEMTITYKSRKERLYAGECAFLSRNNKIDVQARPYDGVEFKGAFLTFTKRFLMNYFHTMDCSRLPEQSARRMSDVVKLDENLSIESLFLALSAYFRAWKQPTKQYMELKESEGVDSLIDMNPRFCINLFDFVGPWKIDILDFMEESYTDSLTLAEMALFTGRSLAAFKRDFKNVSDLSPERWIMNRRVEEAYRLMKEEGAMPKDIYLSLGFKSLSHFSTSIKKKYGKSPSELFAKPKMSLS